MRIKNLLILATAIMPFAQMYSTETIDYEKKYGEYSLYFKLDNKTARLVQIEVTDFDANIIIPEEIEGFAVTEIGQKNSDSEADPSDFSDFDADCCSVFLLENVDPYYLSEISSISIPPSVTSIWPNAFSGEEFSTGQGVKFQEVNIPSTVKAIGAGAFKYTSFKDVTLPDALTDIYPNTFDNCKELSKISIGRNITEVWERAFYGINENAVIHIDAEAVPTIKKSSFSNGCSAEIHVPFGTMDDYQAKWKHWNLQFVEMNEGQTSSIATIRNPQLFVRYSQGRIQAESDEPILVSTAAGNVISLGHTHIDLDVTPGVYILKSGVDVQKILVK